MAGHLAFGIDDDLKLSIDGFRDYAQTAVAHAHETHDCRHADFASAFGCEAICDAESDVISDTALRTMSGAGHQHFSKTMRDIIADTSPEQLTEALFGPWRYRDLKLSLRFEGIPLLPCMPVDSRLETTGFRGTRARDTFWTWPIWLRPLSLDAIRSVLALRELQADDDKINRDELQSRGIIETYRSQRLTIGKFRNFTPARSV